MSSPPDATDPAAQAAHGDAAWARGDALGAIGFYAKALAGNPRDARSAMNLAHALAACGNHDAALQWMRHAQALDPSDPVLEMNLGTIHQARGEIAEAAACYARAIARRPDYAEAWLNSGNAALYAGDAAAAVQAFDRALALAPQLRVALSNIIYALSYLPDATAADIRERAVEWDRRFGAPPVEKPPRAPRRSGEKIRLGYVSADMGNHPIGHFMAGVMEHHARDAFTVTVYSERAVEDELSARLRERSDTWCKTTGMGDADMANRIRADGIDILVDLAGHTAGNRLPVFALRPAPVQLSWMGSVGTTGLQAMDGIIADRFHVPADAEADYVEHVWRLPDSFLCYTPPGYAPAVGELPARRNGAITFGCFSNPAKINGPLLASWAEILRRLPGSRLLLKYRWMDSSANRERIVAAMTAAGIAPERLVIEGEAKHAELLRRYNDVDIALDTSPYSGGGTTLEALWMGVPVLTRPVARFAGRHSFSFLSVLGLNDWIAATPDEYVAAATRHAANLERLDELRRGLRGCLAASPLCDTRRFTRKLEAIYVEAADH